jgi:hypothetical protein
MLMDIISNTFCKCTATFRTHCTMACIERVGNICTWVQRTPGECILPLILLDVTSKYCSKEQPMVSTCRLLCDMPYSLQGQHVNTLYSCFSARKPYGLGVVLIRSEANAVIALSSNTVNHNCSLTLSNVIVSIHAVQSL